MFWTSLSGNILYHKHMSNFWPCIILFWHFFLIFCHLHRLQLSQVPSLLHCKPGTKTRRNILTDSALSLKFASRISDLCDKDGLRDTLDSLRAAQSTVCGPHCSPSAWRSACGARTHPVPETRYKIRAYWVEEVEPFFTNIAGTENGTRSLPLGQKWISGHFLGVSKFLSCALESFRTTCLAWKHSSNELNGNGR